MAVKYVGISEGDTTQNYAVYVERDGVRYALPLVYGAAQHSSEFSWGYGGSGPAQLAFSILADYLNLKPAEHRIFLYGNHAIPEIEHGGLYQRFKSHFVQRWPQDQGWELTDEEIAEWLTAHPIAKVCSTHRQPIEISAQGCIECMNALEDDEE